MPKNTFSATARALIQQRAIRFLSQPSDPFAAQQRAFASISTGGRKNQDRNFAAAAAPQQSPKGSEGRESSSTDFGLYWIAPDDPIFAPNDPICAPEEACFAPLRLLKKQKDEEQAFANAVEKRDQAATPLLQPFAQTHRVWNFSAGPAALSDNVMRKAQAEFTNWGGNSGMGFIEMSHRDVGGPVQNTMESCQNRVRELLDVPDNYHILFMPGGAHQQFSAIPLNLCGDDKPVISLVDTGYWAMRAEEHCRKYGEVKICSVERGALGKPEEKWVVPENARYVHLCMNETIAGLEYQEDPDVSKIELVPVGSTSVADKIPGKTMASENIPLICDATSTILSRPMDISKYGVVFASSGKNLGPAGITMVIARDDLVNSNGEKHQQHSMIPQMMSWAEQANSVPIQNIYNTPPTFNMYMLDLVLAEYQEQGGLDAMQKKAQILAGKCYDFIDSSTFYRATVPEGEGKQHRSLMNVCFQVNVAGDSKEAIARRIAFEKRATKEAAEAGIHQLFGHPLFGGLRITAYNGMSADAVADCLEFLEHYAQKYADEL
jgi:phosphoserine aminotransferase